MVGWVHEGLYGLVRGVPVFKVFGAEFSRVIGVLCQVCSLNMDMRFSNFHYVGSSHATLATGD